MDATVFAVAPILPCLNDELKSESCDEELRQSRLRASDRDRYGKGPKGGPGWK
jgi:hypothetical protein